MTPDGYLAPAQALALFALQPDTLPQFLEFCRQFGPGEPEFYDADLVQSDLEHLVRLLPLVEHSVGIQVMESLVAEVSS